jgi:THO complex subunit 1 transcription elongation factor
MTMAARMKAKSDTDSATAYPDDIEAYFGCKYLTSSDLLSLQIRDPSFRLQLAAQILFYINFLRYD